MASVRRSASASSASRVSRSRSIATPSSDASAGISRRRAAIPRGRGSSRWMTPTRRAPATSG